MSIRQQALESLDRELAMKQLAAEIVESLPEEVDVLAHDMTIVSSESSCSIIIDLPYDQALYERLAARLAPVWRYLTEAYLPKHGHMAYVFRHRELPCYLTISLEPELEGSTVKRVVSGEEAYPVYTLVPVVTTGYTD